MTGQQVLLDEVVFTDYGQFDLTWTASGGFDGDSDRYFEGQINGLVGAADPSGVYIGLGRRSGGSRVRVVLLDQQPARTESQWEDVVEVSTTLGEDAEPYWTTWAGESGGDLSGLTVGNYRVRVSAKGRDLGQADEFADGVVDEYLVELWRAENAPDAILRTTSESARYWHAQWGGRR